MSCYFCSEPVTKPHGIHGCDEFDICTECREKFIFMRYLSDPNAGSVLGFQCSECGFTCDVPGMIESVTVNDKVEHTIKVDSQHKFCQSCGKPSRSAIHAVT